MLPRASYGSFRAACDSLERLLKVALGAWADSATFERGPVSYVYRNEVELFHSPGGRPMWELVFGDGPITVTGLRVTVSTATDDAPGHERIEAALNRAGWVPDVLGADGHGGRSFDMVCREAICIVEARWDDPGDIEDSTYVAAPGERIEITCVPRPPSHPYRRRAATSN